MGFLDGLLSDLLSSAARSAGSNIGHQLTGGDSPHSMGSPSQLLSSGRNVVQIGAVLVGAGVIAQELFQEQPGKPANLPPLPPPLPGTTAAMSPIPPLPPLPPGAAVAQVPPLPPLPPVPSATPANTTGAVLSPADPASSRELTFALARAMVAAAMADGQFASEERQMVEKRLKEAELNPDQQRRLELDLQTPATPGELARLVSDSGQREALYRFAGLVILADRQVAPPERAWLDNLAAALGFDPGRKQSLEQQIFSALG